MKKPPAVPARVLDERADVRTVGEMFSSRTRRSWAIVMVVVLGGSAAATGWFAARYDWLGVRSGDEPAATTLPPAQAAKDDAPAWAVADAVVASVGGQRPRGEAEVGVFGPRCTDPGPASVVRTATLRPEGGAPGVIRVAAFGAGLGHVALESERGRLEGCAGVQTSGRGAGVGVESFVASDGDAVGWWWRRGDVVVSITAVGEGSRATVASLSQVADEALGVALVGVCADPAGGVGDELRNPGWPDFEGRIVVREVRISEMAPAAVPTAEESQPPSSSTVPPYDYRVVVDDPALVPAPVPLVRSEPERPGPAPTSPATGSYRERVADPEGPGCGWEFVGTEPARFDAERSRSEAVAARAGELARLEELRRAAEAEVAVWQASWRRFWVEDAAWQRYLEYRAALSAAERRAAELEAARTTTTTTSTSTTSTTTTTTPPPLSTTTTTAPPSSTTTTTTAPGS